MDPHTLCSLLLRPNDDVVDGDVDKLDKEANEAHETKANSSGYGYLGEFLSEKLKFEIVQRRLF
jgi:hypothetical protein